MVFRSRVMPSRKGVMADGHNRSPLRAIVGLGLLLVLVLGVLFVVQQLRQAAAI